MVLIGEYTQLPDWIPVQAGSGILALERGADGVYREAGVCPTENPSYLVPGDGACFFAVQEGGQGGLARCKKTADGAIALDKSIRFPGSGSCHICFDRRTDAAYVANYESGSLTVVGGATGNMGVLQQFSYSGSGPDPTRQAGPHIHSSWLSPGGGELFVADLGADQIYRYLRNPDGSLYPNPRQPSIPFPPGSGPRHMAFHHSLPVAYVTAELSNQIFMLQFGADNTATALAFWETAQRREGVVLTAHLQLSRRYGMLYACVRGRDELVWFSVEPGSGLLSLRGRCPSGGRFPRHFLLDEETGDLLVANQLSGDVCVFRVDPSGDVAPTPVQRISAPSAAAVMRLGAERPADWAC